MIGGEAPESAKKGKTIRGLGRRKEVGPPSDRGTDEGTMECSEKGAEKRKRLGVQQGGEVNLGMEKEFVKLSGVEEVGEEWRVTQKGAIRGKGTRVRKAM